MSPPAKLLARAASPVLLLVLALSGCNHSDPFPPGQTPNVGPRNSTPPVQLTLNLGQDLWPAWLTDGSGLAYSYEHPDTADRDVCLGVLPRNGGTRTTERCFTGDLAHSQVDVLTEPAPGPDGRFAWLELHGPRGKLSPDSVALRIGRLDLRDPGQTVLSLPYLSPSGQQIFTATHLAWLGSQALVYVGAEVQYSAPCQNCKLDTLVIGREVTRLDLSVNPPAITVIPGTDNATSVWPSASGDAVYYTVGGDSQVFHRVLATGAVDVVYDFGGLGIARDAQVVGSELVAVVGGRVTFQTSPLFGQLQVDSGGYLYYVNLGTTAQTGLGPATQLFRHPALSPDGALIAAETYDTTAGAALISDLYLFDAP